MYTQAPQNYIQLPTIDVKISHPLQQLWIFLGQTHESNESQLPTIDVKISHPLQQLWIFLGQTHEKMPQHQALTKKREFLREVS